MVQQARDMARRMLGRLKPPYRPEHLDPWPRERHDRDKVLVPESARQREDQRAKRRKTDADGDAIVTEMQNIISEPQPITLDGHPKVHVSTRLSKSTEG
jgi:hypothetical protein